MKKTLVRAALVFLTLGISASQDMNVKWIHGSEPCSDNKDVPFQVHAYNDDTFILRENKCIHGHEFTRENTHINSRGARICLACREAYNAKRRNARSSDGC